MDDQYWAYREFTPDENELRRSWRSVSCSRP